MLSFICFVKCVTFNFACLLSLNLISLSPKDVRESGRFLVLKRRPAFGRAPLRFCSDDFCEDEGEQDEGRQDEEGDESDAEALLAGHRGHGVVGLRDELGAAQRGDDRLVEQQVAARSCRPYRR